MDNEMEDNEMENNELENCAHICWDKKERNYLETWIECPRCGKTRITKDETIWWEKMKIKIGTRFFYQGDQANAESYGTIVEILPSTKYSSIQYKVKYDKERFDGDTKSSILDGYLFDKKDDKFAKIWVVE